MNTLEVYGKNDKIAKLAKVRCRIVQEDAPQVPWKWMDMVFTQNVIVPGEEKKWPDDAVWHFTCKFDGSTTYWYTTTERLTKYFDSDVTHHTPDALRKLEAEEKEVLRQYCEGEVFGVIREEWSDADREWKHVDSLYGMYGADSVADCMCDIKQDGDVICCDEDVESHFTMVQSPENTTINA